MKLFCQRKTLQVYHHNICDPVIYCAKEFIYEYTLNNFNFKTLKEKYKFFLLNTHYVYYYIIHILSIVILINLPTANKDELININRKNLYFGNSALFSICIHLVAFRIFLRLRHCYTFCTTNTISEMYLTLFSFQFNISIMHDVAKRKCKRCEAVRTHYNLELAKKNRNVVCIRFFAFV